ncbi:RHS repeat-associated core domain-containing protein [Gemmata sp.]|uniref:RHS repeat-associated core domain-containing protein n=1 Tax=Gemmata sp. TaxID=1914242 RepID=UPI003F70B55F
MPAPARRWSVKSLARAFRTRVWDYLLGNLPLAPRRARLAVEALEGRDLLAVSLTLFDTGVDAAGAALADDQTDPHYQLVSPGGTGLMPGAARTITSDGFPIGPWAANLATSRWVVPAATDGDGNAPAGTFRYRTTVDLTGVDPATVTVSGTWAADDAATILLNGVGTGVALAAPGFTALAPFALTAGFRPGVNVIEFVVTNGGGPTGLRVAGLTGTGEPAPTATVPANGTAAGNGGLFNTGVGPDGSPLPDAAAPAASGLYSTGAGLANLAPDPHFSVTAAPSGYAGGTKVRTAAGGYPIGPWAGDTAGSAWVVPAAADAQGNAPPGTYTYATTVTVTDPANLVLSGTWAADDQARIFVNGTDTGAALTGFGGLAPFALSGSYLVAGANTVEFRVTNAGSAPNPTGLRVEWDPIGPAVDPHWTVVSAPTSTLVGPAKVVPAGAYPFPLWVANDDNSRWVAPLATSADGSGPVGTYAFQTTFSLAGYDPATAALTGRWSADNQGVEAYLNGVPLGLTVTGPDPGTGVEAYRGYADFAVAAGTGGAVFLPGTNTLTFVLRNDPVASGSAAHTPVGLRVDDLHLTAAPAAVVFSDTQVTPGAVVTGTAGEAFAEAVVATFTDADDTRTAADYTATIDWGDGTVTDAEVTGGAGSFVVTGTPPYADPGAYGVTVTVTARYAGGTVTREAATHLSAAIAAPAVEVTGVPVAAVKCVPTAAAGTPVATFALPDGATADRYAAAVRMGDGSGVVPGTWLGDDGAGTVTVYVPEQTFNTPGTYAARVVIRDTASNREAGGEVVGTGEAEVTVTDPGAANVAGLESFPVAVTEAAGAEELVASFPLPTGADAGDYSAVIEWGDGSPPAVVAGTDAGGVVEFRAAPGAAEPGVFGVRVAVLHDASGAGTPGTGTLVGVVGTTLTVADAELVADTGVAPADVERSAGDGADEFLVAAFTSGDETDAADRYRAWVTWGDGTESAGTVYGSGGRFWVGGAHQFAAPGAYRVTVRVADVSAAGEVWGTDAAVRVVEVAQGAAYAASVGVARVDPAAAAATLEGEVAWNDPLNLVGAARLAAFGSSGYAEVFAEGPGGTAGAPGYLAPDDYAPGVVVTAGAVSDGGAWGVTAGDAALAVAADSPFGAVEFDAGVEHAPVEVLRFADPFTSDAGYEAVVDWGDGTWGTATVDPLGGGAFAVTAPEHAYAAAGDYRVAVLVRSLEVGPDRAATLLAARAARVADPGAFTAGQRRDERDDATWVPAGPAGEVSPNTGAVRLWHALDFDRSPGTGVGRDPHLVYNSATADPRPVIEGTVPLPAAPGWTAVVTLTWDGVAQEPRTVTVPEDYSGAWVVAARPDDAATEGVHDWTMSVEAYAPGQVPGVDPAAGGWDATGWAQVVDNAGSQYGAGWALDLDWRVVPNADGAGGALLVYGTGESRYFARDGLGFATPPEDFGELKGTCAGFAYTSEFGELWAFDPLGRLQTITDRNGLVTGFDRDPGTGALTGVTTVDGNAVAVAAEGGDFVRLAEAGGRTVDLSLADGHLASIADAGGTRAFTSDGGLVTSETWGTRATGYAYDAEGLVESFTLGADAYAVAPAAAWGLGGIDPNASPVRLPGTGAVTDPRDHATTVTLSRLGRSGTTTFADATSTTAERDAAGQVTARTDERGYTTRSAYDGDGHLTRVSLPDGGSQSFVYDPAFGQVLAAADSYGRTTRYAYDARGNLLSVTDPLHHTTTYTYLAGAFAGLVETVTDARQNTTTYEYGTARRLWRVTDAALGFTRYAYDAAGNVATVTDPLDRVTETTYDGLNRLTASVDVWGAESAWEYNEQGQVTETVDPRTGTTETEYDARGLATSATEGAGTPLARTTWFDYDAAGNLTDVWDPRDYDAPSALAATGESYWTRVRTTYDSRNRPSAVTDGAGYTLADLAGKAGPADAGTLARTTGMAYDAAGNVARVTSRQAYDAEPAGEVLVDAYRYDPVGRVTAATAAGALAAGPGSPLAPGSGRTTGTGYDLNGNPTRSVASDGTVTVVAYDALDRPTRVTEAAGTAVQRSTGTGYDAVGNVAWVTDGLGVRAEFGYDALNRPTAATEAAGTPRERTALTAYDAVGRVTWAYEPLVYGAREYAGEGTAGVTHVGTHFAYNDAKWTVTATAAANLPSNKAVADRSPVPFTRPQTVTQYAPNGQVQSVTETIDSKAPETRTTAYGYDYLGRTTGVFLDAGSAQPRATEWTYDAADNVRTEKRTGGASNAGDAAPSYQSVTDTFGYDAHNRLASAAAGTSHSWSGGPDDGLYAPESVPTAAYRYDARDNLTLAVDPRGTVARTTYTRFDEPEYVFGGGTTGSGGVPGDFLSQAKNTYDARGRLEAVTENRFASGAGDDGGAASVTSAYGYDALGRQTAATEGVGSRVQRTTGYAYDANDRLVAVTDPVPVSAGAAGLPLVPRVTAYAYDELNRPTTTTVAAGVAGASRTTARGYDPAGNVTWEAVPRAYGYVPAAADAKAAAALPSAAVTVTVNAYDPLNRRTASTAAANATAADLGHAPPQTRWTYDGVNRVVLQESPVALTGEGSPPGPASETRRATRYVYDRLDQPTRITEGTTLVPDLGGDPLAGFAPIRSTDVGYDGAGHEVFRETGHVAPGGVADLAERLGRTTSRYDALGRLRATTEWIDADASKQNARVTLYRHDAAGNVEFRTVRPLVVSPDPGAAFDETRVTRTEYDRLNRPTRVTAAWTADPALALARLGHASPVTQYRYDAAGNTTAVVDPLGRTTRTLFDDLKRPYLSVDALGNQTLTAYDGLNRVARTVDARGNATAYAYDALGRRMTVTDALGGVTATAYDAAGNAVAVTDPRGNRTETTFDPLGRAVAVEDALGNVSRTAYDGRSNVVAVTDPLLNRTTYEYNDLDQRVAAVTPLGNRTGTGHRTETAYDSANNAVAVTNGEGETTRFGYDALGRRTTVTDPLTHATTTKYDVFGGVVSVTDGRGNTTATRFDALGRAAVTTDALTRQWKTEYDAASNKVASVDPLTNRTRYEYDAVNRPVATVSPLGSRSKTEYDEVGNVKAATDGMGNRTVYAFDALNRLASVTDPRGGAAKTVYAYDKAGNRTKLTDPSGNATAWEYDALNRPFLETDPLGGTTVTTYDDAGRVEEEVDRLGRVRKFGYDDDGRKTSEAWLATDGSTVQVQTWQYDDADRVTAAVDPDGEYHYAYDEAGQVTQVYAPFGQWLVFGYDEANNRNSVIDSQGGATTVVFDALNRQESERVGGVGVTPVRIDHAYDNRGLRETVTRFADLAGTVPVATTTYGHDADGRLTKLTTAAAGGAVVQAEGYAYDKADRVTVRTDNGVPTAYAYDKASQLTGDGTTAHAYDGSGNRTSPGYATAAGNRTTTDGTWTYTHDAEGNVVGKVNGSTGEAWAYAYDHRNQMTGAERRGTAGGPVDLRVEYAYDAYGNRIARTIDLGGTVTERHFAVDGWDPAKPKPVGTENFDTWADLDGSGALVARRVFGPAVNEIEAREDGAGAVSWYVGDRQGSVRHVLDNSGGLVASSAFDAFGNLASGSVTDRYAFQGMEYDAALDLYHARGRAYDPALGRFTSEDPKGFAAGDDNLYRFVKNSPTNATDPSGMEIWIPKAELEKWKELGGDSLIIGPEINGKHSVKVQDAARKTDDVYNKIAKAMEDAGVKDYIRGITMWHLFEGGIRERDNNYEYERNPDGTFMRAPDGWPRVRRTGQANFSFAVYANGGSPLRPSSNPGLGTTGTNLGNPVAQMESAYHSGGLTAPPPGYREVIGSASTFGPFQAAAQLVQQSPQLSAAAVKTAGRTLVDAGATAGGAVVDAGSWYLRFSSEFLIRMSYIEAMPVDRAWSPMQVVGHQAYPHPAWGNPYIDTRNTLYNLTLSGLAAMSGGAATYESRSAASLAAMRGRPVVVGSGMSGGYSYAAMRRGIDPFPLTQREIQNLKLISTENYAYRILLGESKADLGPCSSIAIDRVTGRISEVYYNDALGRVPKDLTDQIARGMVTVPVYEKTAGAGSHAEIYAVNELLKARPGAKLSEISVWTMELQMKKFFGNIKPPCPQCDHLLPGVEYIH